MSSVLLVDECGNALPMYPLLVCAVGHFVGVCTCDFLLLEVIFVSRVKVRW